MTSTNREIKEITTKNERWCRITKENCEVIISSPYEKDKMEDIVKMVDDLTTKHSSKTNSRYMI